jgi:energy-coupling factor transport system permease protein
VRWSLYVERARCLHRLDPRAKWAVLLAGFVVPFLFAAPAYTGACFGVALAVLVASGCGCNLVRLWWLAAMVAVGSGVAWAVLAQGETVLVWRITEEGLVIGAGAAFKILAAMCAGLTFMGTTTPEEMSRGLAGLGLPYAGAFVVSMAFSLVPSVITNALDVRDAQLARGLDLESGGLLRRARAHVPLLAPMLLMTLRGADQMAMALDCRGFRAGRRRTWLLASRLGARDALALLVVAGYAVGGILLRMRGLGVLPTP